VYIPLGGNRKGSFRTQINILIIFAVSGLWHGASWNFVIWGALNAMFLILLDPILSLNKKNAGKLKHDGFTARFIKSVFIFACWTLSLVFFRAQGLD
jgi:D-alanyl-lipoteichoic acid acyltransferase DltB (MBOAT superfamily)